MTRILVIEDDDAVVGFLDEYLTHEGFEVESAEDGLKGLLKIEISHPDLALLDIMMPDVDGIRVLEQMLEDGGGQLPIPVVVITGWPEAARRCRRLLDPEDVFEKPFDPVALLARIRTHLGADNDDPET